jgi:hypothetical protein
MRKMNETSHEYYSLLTREVLFEKVPLKIMVIDGPYFDSFKYFLEVRHGKKQDIKNDIFFSEITKQMYIEEEFYFVIGFKHFFILKKDARIIK